MTKIFNHEGFSPIALIIAIGLVVALIGGYFLYISNSNTTEPAEEINPPSQTSTQSPKDDRAYEIVKEKYNMTDEQIEILKRVDSSDNSL
jgi:hypothetical protein